MSPTQFYNSLHRMLDGYAHAQHQARNAIAGPRYSFQTAMDAMLTKERDVAQFVLINRNMLPLSTLEEYKP